MAKTAVDRDGLHMLARKLSFKADAGAAAMSDVAMDNEMDASSRLSMLRPPPLQVYESPVSVLTAPGVAAFGNTPQTAEEAWPADHASIMMGLREREARISIGSEGSTRGVGRSPLSRQHSLDDGLEKSFFSPPRALHSNSSRTELIPEPAPYNPYTSGLGIGLGITPLHGSLPMTVPAPAQQPPVRYRRPSARTSIDDGYGSGRSSPSLSDRGLLHPSMATPPPLMSSDSYEALYGVRCSTPSTPSDAQVGAGAGFLEVPPTPVRCSTTGRPKQRKARLGSYQGLEKTKLLATTDLKRTASISEPRLFRFNDHFEFERIIGRSKHSEVWQVVKKESPQQQPGLTPVPGTTGGGLFATPASSTSADGLSAHAGSVGTTPVPNTPKRSAIKRSLRPMESKSERERKMHEVSVVKKLAQHPNIVEYYRCWQQDRHVNVEMELCTGGSVSACLARLPGNAFSAPLGWRFAHEMASGLAHIHSAQPHGLMHLDVKPENIFLTGSDVELSSFKIGDFGLAVTMEEREWEDGDGKYVAPELLCDDTEATPAADIYSLGATLYEAMCGRQLERQAAMEGVVQFPESVPEPMRVLILSMLETSPLRRPTAVQVMGYCEQFYTPALPPSRLRRMDGEHPAGGGADSPECTTSPICAGDGEGDMDMDMDEAITPPFDPNYVGGAFSMTTTPLSRDECMMSPIAPMPCLSTATHTSTRSTVH